MKELKFNFSYLLSRKELYFAIITIFLTNILHAFQVIQYNSGTYVEMIKKSEYQHILINTEMAFQTIIIIAFPVVCAMIFADSSWTERRTKTDYYFFMRMNIKKHIVIRLVMSILVTFVLVFIGFMINYIILYLVLGSGNDIVFGQSMGYKMQVNPSYFLDSLRDYNPVLYTIATSMHVSLLLGLLSGISYGLSFFTRNRIAIYFQITLFMIFVEVIASFLGFGAFSIIKQIQPIGIFSMFNAISLYLILFTVNIILTLLHLRKENPML